MTTLTDLALLAALCTSPECLTACVSPLEPEPKLNITFALPSPCVYRAPPRVEVAAAVPVKRKMASRCDGTASECRMSRPVCGRERSDWYSNKHGRRKFKCL